MATVNFYLREGTTSSKGSVMLFFTYNKSRIKIGVVDHIESKFWDSKNQRAKQTVAFKNHMEFNMQLINKRDEVLNIYRRFLNDNNQRQPLPEEIKELIRRALYPKVEKLVTKKDLIGFVGEFISDSQKGKRLSERGTPINLNTIKIYNTLKNNLIEFSKKSTHDFDLKNINTEVFEDFRDYMIFTKNYTTNTLAKHIRTLRTIINEARERELTHYVWSSKRLRATTEEVEKVYLNKSELLILKNHDFSDEPRLDRVRDLFLIGCWTGLRFSDFSNILPKNIDGEFLNIKTQKTGRKVIIPIHPVVKGIMEKYNGLTENSLPPPISNQKMNEYLKEIVKEAGITNLVTTKFTKAGNQVIKEMPKFSMVSSHTARRSFATNMYLDNFPTLSIMAITGHLTESSFMKYIRVTPSEHAEKLRKHWKKNEL